MKISKGNILKKYICFINEFLEVMSVDLEKVYTSSYPIILAFILLFKVNW